MANEMEKRVEELTKKTEELTKQVEALKAENAKVREAAGKLATFVRSLQQARQKIKAFECEVNKAREDERMALIALEGVRQ